MLIMLLTFVAVLVYLWAGVNALIRLLDWLDSENGSPYKGESVAERIGH